jgi:hypothetical protein
MTPGTPVLILDTYPFGAPPAWLSPDGAATPIALPSGDVFRPLQDKIVDGESALEAIRRLRPDLVFECRQGAYETRT